MATRVFFGFQSFDEALTWDLDTDIDAFHYALGDVLAAVNNEGNAPGSAGSILIPDTQGQQKWKDGFIVPSATPYKHYQIRFGFTELGGTEAKVYRIFYTHFDAESSPTGAVALKMEVDAENTRVRFGTDWRTGAPAWADVADLGAWTAWFGITIDEYNLYSLHVNPSTGKARILKNATEVRGWSAAVGLSVNGMKTPSVGATVDSGKGDPNWEIAIADIAAIGEDTETTGLTTSFAAHARYPVADIAGGGWTATGNAADCSGDLWRAVDDVEDADDQANDYISEAEAGQADQLFEIGDFSSGVVEAVYLASCAKLNAIDKFIAKLSGGSLQTYTPTFAGTVDGRNAYAFLEKAPDGAAWTRAKFNSLEAGVRSDAGNAGKINTFHVGAYGTGLARPTKATACPAAAAARRRLALAV